ncbi:hypothetical protein [Paracoccus albus]|nr:hypothetical protein [Paracoccus albus]WBU61716.1 hypothetical protein PAF20_07430 [Paracoccus albus]
MALTIALEKAAAKQIGGVSINKDFPKNRPVPASACLHAKCASQEASQT